MTTKDKHIFFVSCAKEWFKETFKKSKTSDVIIFEDIRKRLTSREVSKEPPSDEIVKFHITRRVHEFTAASRTDFLYYHMDGAIDDGAIRRIRAFERSMGSNVCVYLMVEDRDVFDAYRAKFANLMLVEQAML